MKTILKRWIKNAVAIVVMLALCGSMVFTMSYAKSHAQASDMPQMSQGSDSSGGPGSGGTPPDQSGSSDSNSQSGDQQSGQPPAKPEDSGNSGQSGNSSNMPQGAPDQGSDLSTLYYILFGAECFLLALALTEVIITKGNKRTLRQSLLNRDKAIIFALTVILVTAGGTFLCSKITTDYMLANSNSGAPGQSSAQMASYTAVKGLTEDTTLKSGSYSSKSADENVVLATGDIKAALSGLTITKTGDSDGSDNSNFYGTNSGIIAKDGASLTLKNLKVTTKASGANGVFSYGGSATTDNEGDTLYVTNTTASINLKNNTITNNDSEGNFLRAQADSWGSSGSNGGNVTLTMTKQKASGNIVIDSISTLDMTMKSGSFYTGTINGDNSAKSIKLTLDKKSRIKLTGDSYVTSLDDADTDYSNIDFNGYTLYVNGTAINK